MNASPCGNTAENALNSAVANGSWRTQCRDETSGFVVRKLRRFIAGNSLDRAAEVSEHVVSIMGRIQVQYAAGLNMCIRIEVNVFSYFAIDQHLRWVHAGYGQK